MFLQTVQVGPLILAHETMNGIVLVSDNCFGQIASIHSFIIFSALSYHLYFMRKYMSVCWVREGGTPCQHKHKHGMPKQLPFRYFSFTSFLLFMSYECKTKIVFLILFIVLSMGEVYLLSSLLLLRLIHATISNAIYS